MITFIAFSFIIMYIIEAFSSWEFNPKHWDITTRDAIIWISIVIGSMVAIVNTLFTGKWVWF